MVQYLFYFVFGKTQTAVHRVVPIHIVIGNICAAVQIKAGHQKVSVAFQAAQNAVQILFSPVRLNMVKAAAVENKVEAVGVRGIVQQRRALEIDFRIVVCPIFCPADGLRRNINAGNLKSLRGQIACIAPVSAADIQRVPAREDSRVAVRNQFFVGDTLKKRDRLVSVGIKRIPPFVVPLFQNVVQHIQSIVVRNDDFTIHSGPLLAVRAALYGIIIPCSVVRFNKAEGRQRIISWEIASAGICSGIRGRRARRGRRSTAA